MDTGKVTWEAGVLVTAGQEPGGPSGYVPHCRVFWGSHGCHRPRGHPPEVSHSCDCCECPGEACEPSCVAKPPWYGPETKFYGEDAEALGLPGFG